MQIQCNDVRLCNCAKCGVELVGERMANAVAEGIVELPELYQDHGRVEGRYKGRPYCFGCIATVVPPLPKLRLSPVKRTNAKEIRYGRAAYETQIGHY